MTRFSRALSLFVVQWPLLFSIATRRRSTASLADH